MKLTSNFTASNTGILLRIQAIVNPVVGESGLKNITFSVHLPLVPDNVGIRSSPKGKWNNLSKVLSWDVRRLNAGVKIGLRAKIDTGYLEQSLARWKSSKKLLKFETVGSNVSGLLISIDSGSSRSQVTWRSKRRTVYKYIY